MYKTIDNIWSLLFMTGYLTQRGNVEGRQFKLAIPNLEIRDILVEPDTGNMGIIIEVKYAHNGDLDAAFKEALIQIKDTRYEADLMEEGVEKILKYRIACYKKHCKVILSTS